jgi:SH3/ankyrin repeat-containing protein
MIRCIYVYIIHFMFQFQLKYKRRVYKMLQMDEKQLKSINSKASHKKFLENVGSNNVDKINKMCVKGLDPNFHCENTGGKYFFYSV